MRTTIVFVCLVVILSIAARVADADECAPSRLVVVLDRSSSMNGDADPIGMLSKWEAARGAIDRVAASYGTSVELGLATFPYPDACGPGRLEVAPALGRRDAIATALAAAPPSYGAYTPLGETLLALAQDGAVVGGGGAAHAVVITDGFQWCDPYDPEARGLPIDGVKTLADAGVTVFVVGFGGGVDEVTLDRMALEAGTARAGCVAGSVDPATRCYYQADDPASLLAALMDIAAVTSAETCDGQDNDCDGTVDEGACPTPAVDAGVDAFGRDAGAAEDGGGVAAGGCGCSAAAEAGATGGAVLVFGVGLVILLVRSRPRARRRRDRGPDRARR
ncbi:MAG TPA: VWA domain-containing protein [Kofleriaceae bacterium]|nr:VWA domain-containing protein [Kofleriaceae bacterium]